MLWLWIVIAAQFANAGALFLDKLLLTKKFPHPVVLTFWTAVWNLLGVVFVFWNFDFSPGYYILVLSLLSGIAFVVALQFLYSALREGEATHITPLVGAVVPVVSFIISYFWLGENLSFNQGIAVVLLVIGALLICYEKSAHHIGVHIGMVWAIIAGVFFAVSYVLAHGVYLQASFSTGFVWARIGCAIAILPFLLIPRLRKMIFVRGEKRQKKARSGLVILAVNKSMAALYFLGMNFALSLASATIVNALAGLQYVLLFTLVYISSKKLPRFFNEQFTRLEIAQEIIAILFIVAGLGFIVF